VQQRWPTGGLIVGLGSGWRWTRQIGLILYEQPDLAPDRWRPWASDGGARPPWPIVLTDTASTADGGPRGEHPDLAIVDPAFVTCRHRSLPTRVWTS
jgi:hypothetical protein